MLCLLLSFRLIDKGFFDTFPIYWERLSAEVTNAGWTACNLPWPPHSFTATRWTTQYRLVLKAIGSFYGKHLVTRVQLCRNTAMLAGMKGKRSNRDRGGICWVALGSSIEADACRYDDHIRRDASRGVCCRLNGSD